MPSIYLSPSVQDYNDTILGESIEAIARNPSLSVTEFLGVPFVE